jgi:cellobiose phosphorylase
MLLQAMLGIRQDAPRGKLYVDPALPEWMPDVTLRDLRLGRQRFDIRFRREGNDTVFEVLKGRQGAVVRFAAEGGRFRSEPHSGRSKLSRLRRPKRAVTD